MDRFLEESVSKHHRAAEEVLYYASWVVMIVSAILAFMYLNVMFYSFSISMLVMTLVFTGIAVYIFFFHDRLRTEYDYTFTNGSMDFAQVFNNRMAVLSDNVAGLKALVKQAWACGHRRIAFIHGEKTSVTENRIAGFYQACEELGLEIPEEYVRDGVYHDVERCAEETRALLALPQRPTCILFPDDFSAMGGCIALQEAGLSIPEDISVMGYDGIYLSRVMKPQLVTWQQNTKMLGRMAADKLVQMIEHPRVTLAEQIPVTGKLLEGGSVRSIE